MGSHGIPIFLMDGIAQNWTTFAPSPAAFPLDVPCRMPGTPISKRSCARQWLMVECPISTMVLVWFTIRPENSHLGSKLLKPLANDFMSKYVISGPCPLGWFGSSSEHSNSLGPPYQPNPEHWTKESCKRSKLQSLIESKDQWTLEI